MRRSNLISVWGLLVIAMLAVKPASAASITIVDTGPGDETMLAVLGGWSGEPNLNQWVAAEFTVFDTWIITDVQGWIIPVATGDVRFRLYSDGGDVPNSALFEQLLTIEGPGPSGWYGPSGLNWLIGPGSYWLAFETPDTFWGFLPSPSVNPLPNEAYRNGTLIGYQGFDNADIGVRVFAEGKPDPDPSPVPDALSSVAVFGSGLLLAAGVHLWRRHRTVVMGIRELGRHFSA